MDVCFVLRHDPAFQVTHILEELKRLDPEILSIAVDSFEEIVEYYNTNTEIETAFFRHTMDYFYPSHLYIHRELAKTNENIGLTVSGAVYAENNANIKPVWVKTHGWNIWTISCFAIHRQGLPWISKEKDDNERSFLFTLTEDAIAIGLMIRPTVLHITANRPFLGGQRQYDYNQRFAESQFREKRPVIYSEDTNSSFIRTFVFCCERPRTNTEDAAYNLRMSNNWILLIEKELQKRGHVVMYEDIVPLVPPSSRQYFFTEQHTIKLRQFMPFQQTIDVLFIPEDYNINAIGLDARCVLFAAWSHYRPPKIPRGATHFFTSPTEVMYHEIVSRGRLVGLQKPPSSNFTAFCNTSFWKPAAQKDIHFAFMSRFFPDFAHPDYRIWDRARQQIVKRAQKELNCYADINWEFSEEYPEIRQTYEEYTDELPRTEFLLHFSTHNFGVNSGLVEALACGCVTFENPGPTPATEDYGLVDRENCLFFNDWDELVKQYEWAHAVENKEKIEKISKNARDLALKHDTREVVMALLEYIAPHEE